jgi:hypothetical protein
MDKLWVKLKVFSDEQRVLRLQKCQDLKRCLDNCLQVQQEMLKGKKDAHKNMIDMEGCVSGIRMVKYFDWRESVPTRVFGENDTTGKPNKVVALPKAKNKANQVGLSSVESEIPTCARQVHSLWGCRAVALACSPDLVQLRNCFREIGDKEAILSVPYFGYTEGNNESQSIPCREFQQKLAQCVTKRAAELEQRVRARKEERE